MPENDKKRIIIMGGGIGGLATAHQLLKNINTSEESGDFSSNYSIEIYERNSELGGIARSKKVDGEHSEVCFHAIGAGYTSFIRIMNDITDENGVKVISHLKPLNNYVYPLDNKFLTESDVAFFTSAVKFEDGYKKMYGSGISFFDKIRLAKLLFKCNSMCKERLETYDSELWSKRVADLHPNIRRWIVDSTAIYLGMAYNKISTYFMFQLMRQTINSELIDSSKIFYSFDKPMNDVLFDVWKKYLEDRGVKIYLNTEVKHIDYEENIIKSIEVEQKLNKVRFANYSDSDEENDVEEKVIEGDIFINSMDAKNIYQLYPFKFINQKIALGDLYTNSRQIQCQVLFYIPYNLGIKNPVVYTFPNSPWFLMFRPEAVLWDLEDKDYLSVGIGIFDVKGSLFGKTAAECNPEELAQECWHQIQKSQHNLKLGRNMPKWDVWYSFKYDEETKLLDTYEPKFSNNVNTLKDRLNYKDNNIVNLYHANATCITGKNVFNMEGAAESGISVADIIHFGEIHDENVIRGYIDMPWYWRVLQKIDSIIFRIQRLFTRR